MLVLHERQEVFHQAELFLNCGARRRKSPAKRGVHPALFQRALECEERAVSRRTEIVRKREKVLPLTLALFCLRLREHGSTDGVADGGGRGTKKPSRLRRKRRRSFEPDPKRADRFSCGPAKWKQYACGD